MKTNFKTNVMGTVVALIAFTGCASNAPNLDSDFGRSTAIWKSLQILDPDASANNTRAATLDGKSAHEVMTRYTDSYKAPAPQGNVFTIGVGGTK